MARQHNSPFFARQGCEVLRADIRYQTPALSNRNQAAKADIFNVSVPLLQTWSVLEEVAPVLQPGSLALISPSIQVPKGVDPSQIVAFLRSHGVDIGFVHFMFGPAVRSWRGQSVMFGFVEPLINPAWKELVITWLRRERMVVWHGTFESHDQATQFTQVHPMLLAGLSSAVWRTSPFPLEDLFELAGPPAWMSAYGQVASLRQRRLISEIITYHPSTLLLLDFYIEYLTQMRVRVANGDVASVESLIYPPRIETERLADITRRYQRHVQVEADMRGGAHGFYFSRALNQIGLLEEVLARYDAPERRVEKSTTGAQTDPRKGGVEIFIGPADPDNPKAQEARLAVIAELHARPIRPITPHGEVIETFYRV